MQMSRRHILGLLAGAGGGLLSPTGPAIAQRADPNARDDTRIAEGPFQGNRASLEHYEVPQWFRDAKFGIWAHWGPQSAIEAGIGTPATCTSRDRTNTTITYSVLGILPPSVIRIQSHRGRPINSILLI